MFRTEQGTRHMRGHIRRRNERWQAQVYIGLGADGRRKYRSKTFDRQHDAQSWLRKQLDIIEGGGQVDTSKLTVAQYARIWLDRYAANAVAARTLDEYRKILEGHVFPRLGHIKLAKLRADQIQGYYEELLKSGRKRVDRKDGTKAPRGLSLRTVHHHHACLHKALRDAVRAGYLPASPMDGVIPPKPPRREARCFTPAELQKILAVARRTTYYLPIAIAAYTGMRRGEILGLQWGDVDMERGVIHVQRSLERTKGQGLRLKDTKTDKSRRAIPVPPQLVAALEAEYYVGLPDDAPVIVGEEGRAVTPDAFTYMFRYVREQAGIAHGSLKALRHTHATILLRQNIQPKVVQERLGHSTITTTMDVYSHVMPTMQAEASAAFAEALMEGSEQLLAEGNVIEQEGEG